MKDPGEISIDRRRLVAAGAVLACAALAGAALRRAAAEPPGDLIGAMRLHVARDDDTLPDLAVDNDLGYGEVLAANPGIDPWLIPRGTVIVLPAAHLLPTRPRRGIVVNLGDQRIYFFLGGAVRSYPIGIAVEERDMRLGTTRILRKQEHPAWYPPPSVKEESPWLPDVVPPGPDNPLGSRALYLEWPRVLIHGTNKPYGVGRRVSHGCIRLYEPDIAALYHDAAVGLPVTFVFEPVKLGWASGMLYLEIHPTLDQIDALENGEDIGRDEPAGLRDLVLAAAAEAAGRIDWDVVALAARRRNGIPVAIVR